MNEQTEKTKRRKDELSARNRILPERQTRPQPVKNTSILMTPEAHYRIHKRLPLMTNMTRINPLRAEHPIS